jgi:hypothetical protein
MNGCHEQRHKGDHGWQTISFSEEQQGWFAG